MEIQEKLDGIVRPAAESRGVRLVELQMSGRRRIKVRIIISKKGGVTMEDCERVSQAVSAALDRDDPFAGPYVLEVTSPGMDRPLVTEEDFAERCGRLVRIELDPSAGFGKPEGGEAPGQNRPNILTGKILEAVHGVIKIQPSGEKSGSGGSKEAVGEALEISLNSIRSAVQVPPW